MYLYALVFIQRKTVTLNFEIQWSACSFSSKAPMSQISRTMHSMHTVLYYP